MKCIRPIVVAVFTSLLVACGSSGNKPGAGGAGGNDTGDGGGGTGGGQAGTGGTTQHPRDAGAMTADAAPDAIEPAADAAASDLSVADHAPEPVTSDASTGADAAAGKFALTSTGFLTRGADLVFPATASYPMDQSPPFAWSGAPAGTRSFALTFVDGNIGATKWVVWDIPATVDHLPGNLSKSVHPTEVPEASQRGSLGRTGYSGPGVAGPPLRTYQFILWALDVDKLSGTDGAATDTLRTKILPMHALAQSAPLTAKGQLGGP